MLTRLRTYRRPMALFSALLMALGLALPNMSMAAMADAGVAGNGVGQRVLLCTAEGMVWVRVVDGEIVDRDSDGSVKLPKCPACSLHFLAAAPTPADAAIGSIARRLLARLPVAANGLPAAAPETAHAPCRAPPAALFT